MYVGVIVSTSDRANIPGAREIVTEYTRSELRRFLLVTVTVPETPKVLMENESLNMSYPGRDNRAVSFFSFFRTLNKVGINSSSFAHTVSERFFSVSG